MKRISPIRTCPTDGPALHELKTSLQNTQQALSLYPASSVCRFAPIPLFSAKFFYRTGFYKIPRPLGTILTTESDRGRPVPRKGVKLLPLPHSFLRSARQAGGAGCHPPVYPIARLAAGTAKRSVVMDYEKEYAILVGQVDQVISLLEEYGGDDLVVRKAVELLTTALQEAEDRYILLAEGL